MQKRSDSTNDWDLAKAHYNHAKEIPDAIREYIDKDVRKQLPDETVAIPIGGDAIMHSHNTFPAMAQKYKNLFGSYQAMKDLMPKIGEQ